MSRYKIPEHLVVVEDYPKTATGKIQKFQLRENLIKLLKQGGKNGNS
jgi:acyl-CoA synthetase (AMP-forming)/AMP-acid ligase II